MRIVQITPGSGGTFYCQNCLRDVALVRAVRAAGHDVLMVPLYLPIAGDTGQPDRTPVFFGGINVYLQQKLRLFRRTPRWVDRVFDSPRLLRWASRQAGATSPQDLAETTISMLRGEQGRQAKELERLAEWLDSAGRCDIVCLSNALLAGLARRIKAATACPLACMLQDEDAFLDGLPDACRGPAWQAVAAGAMDVDGFLAVSEYYRQAMIERLHLPADRVHVVHGGLDAAGYEPPGRQPDQPAIGFLERICFDKGFDILLEAFVILRSRGFGWLKLRVSGGSTPEDKPFLAACRRRMDQAGLAGEVEFVQHSDRDGRIAFLRSLSVLSVPARHKEAFGLYVLEALAAGVPVVMPDHGAMPELLGHTGGGATFRPNDPQSLADALGKLLADPQHAGWLGQAGRQVVLEEFSIERAAARFMDACQAVMSQGRNTPSPVAGERH